MMLNCTQILKQLEDKLLLYRGSWLIQSKHYTTYKFTVLLYVTNKRYLNLIAPVFEIMCSFYAIINRQHVFWQIQ
jgi:hypothetical protein